MLVKKQDFLLNQRIVRYFVIGSLDHTETDSTSNSCNFIQEFIDRGIGEHSYDSERNVKQYRHLQHQKLQIHKTLNKWGHRTYGFTDI